jgi:hypothetical protein
MVRCIARVRNSLPSLRISLVAIAGLALSACIAVDSRVDGEVPAQDSLERINGKFWNKPSYSSSKMGFTGPQDLGELLRVPFMGADGIPTIGKFKVDAVQLSYANDTGLTASFERGGTVVARSTLTAKNRLEVSGNSLVIRESGCGDADSIQKGCVKNSKTLFVNDAGNLVVVDSGGGAGLIGLIPAGVYAKLMSVFPRVR